MIRNITLSKLLPDDWMILVRSKEFVDIVGPSLNRVESLPAKHNRKVCSNGINGGSGETIAEHPKCRSGLGTTLVFEGTMNTKPLTG
jgi:hypothetical protein